jgi:hypothetical protein
MGIYRASMRFRPGATAAVPLACLCACALLLTAAIAAAQDAAKTAPPAAAEQPGFFGSIFQWFDKQAANLNSGIKGAGSSVQNFGREAGIAAKTTVDNAKDAADAVVRIPAARMISGHEKCMVAPNGAPDCVAAATTLCKAKGFDSGKSMDMTTAEVCPAKVMLSGRGGAECHDETFVSRALCQ